MGTNVFKSFRELCVGEVREREKREKMCGMYWPIVWVAAENLLEMQTLSTGPSQ